MVAGSPAAYSLQLLLQQRGLCIAAFTAAMQLICCSFYGGSTFRALQLLQLQCSPFVTAFTVATRSARCREISRQRHGAFAAAFTVAARSACCREISRQQHGAFAAAFTVAARSARRRDKSRRRDPYPPPPPNPPPVPKEGDASAKRSASL